VSAASVSNKLLKGALLLHLDPPKVERADVRVRGGKIAEVGPDLAPADGEELHDLAGQWLMPGLVCGHHHLYSALACGMPFVEEPPRSFSDMLAKVWWRLDRALDEESARVSALVGALSALKCGTTTIIDHHASPSFIDGSLEALDESIAEVGQRRVLCYEVTDRGGSERSADGRRAHEALLKAGPSSERAVLVGMHASFTVTDETVEACAALAREHGTAVHIHVAEAEEDETVTGEPLISRMERLGALMPGSIFAHCVHLNRHEIRMLRNAGVTVAHQPRSNMNNGVGYAPLGYFGDSSILGTDGIDGDMLTELKVAYFRAQEADVGLDPAGALAILTRSARYASAKLGVTLGRVEAGAMADLVVLDPCAGPPLRTENLAAAMIFRIASGQVRSVFINGELRLRERGATRVDEARLDTRAQSAAEGVWDRMKELAP
jgi:cytosine/adenosine deaminase-related metal-dependent hydrolase